MNNLSLSSVFQTSRMEKVFKDYVWEAIRSQACQDLYGYYDYRLALKHRLESLYNILVGGAYRPRSGLPLQIARADLLARQLHIAHPDDALILQLIAEALLPFVRNEQPSENAFYSRSHRQPRGIHTIDQDEPYPWYKLWPIYQERILNFEQTKAFLVITDIQAFFDSVRFSVIRRKISDTYAGSQGLVDLMLAIFENFLRREMYAPVALQGIPTINLDAPRLVAHMLLFPVDLHLRDSTSKCFARWMDDINFAVDSVSEARRLIRDVDGILRERLGLRLGGGKTKILSFKDARIYLQTEENQRLNIIETRIKKTGRMPDRQLAGLLKSFAKFRKQTKYGHWDKVVRRYYKVIGKALRCCVRMSKKTRIMLRACEAASVTDFADYSSTQFRQSVLRFWGTLAPSPKRIARICAAVTENEIPDDETSFTAAEVLVSLSLRKGFRKGLVDSIRKHWKSPISAGCFFASAWIVACYGSESDIVQFLNKTDIAWAGNYYYSRQAVALWSLLNPHGDKFMNMKRKLEKLHDSDVAAQMAHFLELHELRSIPSNLRWFLPTNKNLKHIDVRRAIMVRNVLTSPNLNDTDRERLMVATKAKTKPGVIRELALRA